MVSPARSRARRTAAIAIREMLNNPSTPSAYGYRMPAEWEPHVGTWFSWPRPEGISFPAKYDTVPPVYAELIKHLAPVEEVHINVWHADMEGFARELLRKHGAPADRVIF